MLGTQIANYRIEERLGEGGMGVVYKAVDLNLDRRVALKFLSSELSRDPGLIQRFQSEARAQANLNHTNIATLYNFINVDGNWLIAMEYVDGESLEQMIRRAGAMQYQEAIPLFKQVLLGVGFAHRMGIVHRDIKPANIMVNSFGIVKVMDFGIAKALSARNLTRTGVSLGTVAYMSPEQIRNSGVDSRSDIYSLGVTLYEMLTANLPFNSDSDYQIQYDHVNTPPPPLSLYYPYIPAGIEAAVLRAMEKDPAERFAAAEQFGVALESPDVVPVKYQKNAVVPPIAVGSAPHKTVVEAARQKPQGLQPPAEVPGREKGERFESQMQATKASSMSPLVGPKSWASRNRLIAAAAAIAIVVAAGALVFRPKSNTQNAPAAGIYSQSGSIASSNVQSPPPQQPAESGSGAPATLDLQLQQDKSSSQTTDQATTPTPRKRPARVDQNRTPQQNGPAGQTQAALTAPQPAIAPQPSAQSPAQNAGFTSMVRHRHMGALGGVFFGRRTNNPGVTFCIGLLTISPSGSVTYKCTASPSPKGCEPPVSLSRSEIKSAFLNDDGSLHIATFGRGNYDFYGARSTMQHARDAVLAAAR
jgi:serine/threonine protein kinase